MDVVHEVRRARRFLFWQKLTKGLLGVLLFTIAGAIGSLVVDDFIGPSPKLRTLVVFLYFLGIALGILGVVVRSFFRLPSAQGVLEEAERRDPYFRARLLTAHHLLEHPQEAQRLGYSPELCGKILRWARFTSPEAAFGWIYSLTDLRRLTGLTLAPVGLLFLIVLFRGEDAAGIWFRYLEAPALTEAPSVTTVFTPGDMEIPRGESAGILARVAGLPNAPTLLLRDASGVWLRKALVAMPNGFFFAEIDSVDQPYLYRVGDQGIYSPVARITPVDPPEPSIIRWTVHPPSYTGLSPSEIENRERVSVPEGSRVRLSLETNVPLSSGSLEIESGAALPLEIAEDGRTASVDLPPLEKSVALRLLMAGAYDMESTLDRLYLDVGPDRPPQARIDLPEPVADIPDSQKVRIEFEARDDYGLTGAEMVYELNYGGTKGRIPVLPDPAQDESAADWLVESPDGGKTPRLIQAIGAWDLTELDLISGDEVTYWIEVRDNRPAEGGAVGKSPAHTLRFPSLFELYESVREAEEAQVEHFEDIVERQKSIREEIEKTVDEMRQETPMAEFGKPRAPSWDEKQRMQELKKSQEEVAEDLESLDEKMQETLEALREKSETSLRTLEKMSKVRELMDELMTDEMKEILRDFQRMMSQFEETGDPRPLEDLSASLEDFEEELNSLLDLLENTKFERQMEAAVNEARELLEAQEELIERTEQEARRESEGADEGDEGEEGGESAEEDQEDRDGGDSGKESEEAAERLSGEQDAIEERLKELALNLEKLADEAEEKGHAEAETLRETAEEMRDGKLAEDLNQASRELAKKDFQKALSPEESAAERMESMNSKLSEAQSSMCGMNMEMDVAGLMGLIHRSQYLSELEEGAVEDLERMAGGNRWGDPTAKTQLSREQADLAVESERIREAFLDFASKSPFRDFEAARLLERISLDLNQAASRSKDSPPFSVRSLSTAALGKTNEVTRKLMESLQEAAQSQGGQGMESYFQQMRRLIQRQKELNEKTKRLHMQNRTQPSWEQELERIAREQNAIRRELEELAQQKEKAEKILGDLDEVGDGMGQVEKMLDEKITDERVQEKQEQIYTRLLDAEKSMREQDTDRERESTPAAARPAGETGPLTDDEILRRLVQPDDRLINEEVPPRYRNRVRSYYRRLSEEAF